MPSPRSIAAVAWALSLHTVCSAATWYVSPTGNDRWSGMRAAAGGGDGPFATLERAQAAVRQWLQSNHPADEQATVILTGGVHHLTAPLTLTTADSGTETAPVTYRAATDAQSVISGGRVITGWRSEGDSGVWMTVIPEVKQGRWSFRQLFVNGRRYVRARHPNASEYWFRAEKNAGVDSGVGALVYRKEHDLARLAHPGMELVLLRMWDVSRYRLSSIDAGSRTLRFCVPPALKQVTHWSHDGPYYLENAPAFLDAPGEWRLDTETGILRVIPLPDDHLAKATVVAPVLPALIRFQGAAGKPVQHIRFRGLRFAHTTWDLPATGYDGHQADVPIGAAVSGDYVEQVSFRQCSFFDHGRHAIHFRRGCRRITIESCEFSHLGGGAVYIGDVSARLPAPADRTSECNILACEVHHTGEVYHGSPGLWVGYADRNRVVGNHVHHTSYTGISVGWGWTYEDNGAHHNLIADNHLHDIQLMLGDGGGIYTLSRQPGTVIRGNVIHDVHGYRTYGVGIYLDNNSSDILVEDNLVARTIGASLVNNAVGRDNVIRNNVFALPATGVLHINGCKGNRFERNIIYLAEGPLTNANWKDDCMASMDFNVYWRTRGRLLFPGGRTFRQWQAAGFDRHSVVADPGFADPGRGDFRLAPTSLPIKQIGFRVLRHSCNLGTAPPDRRKDPRLVKLFALTSAIHDILMTPQMVAVPGKAEQPATLAADAPPARPVSLQGLVAWWPMDGTVPYQPNHQMHGRLHPSVTVSPGVDGSALAFDGDAGVVTADYAPPLDITDALTICAWIRPAGEQYYKGAFGIVERTQLCRFMLMEPKPPYSVSLSMRSTEGAFFGVTSKRRIPADSWTFVAATYDNVTGRAAVFLNGKLSAERKLKPGVRIAARKGLALVIGRRDNLAFFHGSIDEVCLYNRALLDAEIAQEYQRLATRP